ncbi:MAG: heavy metal-binding domain-containing protein, partial [Bacteroidia bacterium]
MKHIYQIKGMSCDGCRNHVEQALSKVEGVTKVSVDLKKAEAAIEMKSHIPLEKLQETLKKSGGNYSIANQGDEMHKHDNKELLSNHKETTNQNTKGSGVFYCPMHCEGEKTYNKAGSCPVCGMDLVEQPSQQKSAQQYTCPMHPEIIRNEPGSCPICGMNLVPKEPAKNEDDKTYKILLKKFIVAVSFTLPILLITMSAMFSNNPLLKIINQKSWNWIQFALSIPVVFYAAWMFFQRAWKSIITWKLNMFTLVGLGSGVAFVFSVTAMLFPGLFPAQFKSESGDVFVYFEATTVILSLVLLGQLMEAKAHSKTTGAIKELLKLVPSQATLVVDRSEKIISI